MQIEKEEVSVKNPLVIQWTPSFGDRLGSVVDKIGPRMKVADQLGWAYGTIANYINGKAKPFLWNIATLCKLANNTSVDWLIHGAVSESIYTFDVELLQGILIMIDEIERETGNKIPLKTKAGLTALIYSQKAPHMEKMLVKEEIAPLMRLIVNND